MLIRCGGDIPSDICSKLCGIRAGQLLEIQIPDRIIRWRKSGAKRLLKMDIRAAVGFLPPALPDGGGVRASPPVLIQPSYLPFPTTGAIWNCAAGAAGFFTPAPA